MESLITHLSVHHNFGVYYCTQCDYVNDDCNLINDHFKTFHKFKTPLIFMRYNSQDVRKKTKKKYVY